MRNVYRVVCSENKKLYPNKLFIDIYPADMYRPENCFTHDCILKMRQLINPNVSNLEPGILLYDDHETEPLIKFEKTYSRSIQIQQEYMHEKLDNKIIETFKKMRALGKDRTLDVSLVTLGVNYDFFAPKNDNTSPISAKEDALLKEIARQKRIAQKRQELKSYQEIYWSKHPESKCSPQQLMAWKQAISRGD